MSEIEIEGLTVVEGIERIQDCFLFKGLSFEETRALAGICKPITRRGGEPIVEEGEPGEALYMVIDGEATVAQGEGEARRELERLGQGGLFGEMSLVEDLLVSATVVARRDTRLLRIGRWDLERLMSGDARLAAKIYRSFCIILCERLRRENERCAELLARVGSAGRDARR